MEKPKVLFISPSLYDYDEKINNALIKNSFKTIFYKSRYGENLYHHGNILTKSSLRIKNFFFKYKWIDNLKKFEKEHENSNFDYVFVIGIFPLSRNFIKKLRNNNPRIKFLIYLWDSLNSINQDIKLIQLFDQIFIFNKPDIDNLSITDKINKNKYKYLPNFYIEHPNLSSNSEQDINNDLLYISTINSDTFFRFELLNQIIRQCKNYSLNYIFSLKYHPINPISSKLKFFLSSLFKYKRRHYNKTIKEYLKKDVNDILTSQEKKLDEVIELEARSKVIIDLSHPNRQGFTMNVISAIGNKKKLITTNQHIIKAPFYSPNNILIINPEKLEINKDFINKSLDCYDISCLEINNWIKLIFDEDYYNNHKYQFT